VLLLFQEWMAPEMNPAALMNSIRREEAMLVRSPRCTHRCNCFRN
jgi:hypothetical protein